MPRPSILVTESRDFPDEAVRLLEERADVVLADLDRTELLAQVKDTEILWVRLRTSIDRPVLDAAEKLRMIVTPTTGLDHIDLERAESRGIRIIALKGEREFLREIRATAEHTMAILFALLRRIPAAVAHVQDGGWNRDLFKGSELYRKTIGIVGLGRLGQIVAGYMRAMGANVVGADVYPTDVPEGVEMVGFEELLRMSDIISLHIDLKESSKKLFDKDEFALMKPGAILVNTSRGQLLDETALLQALVSGHLGGAALDVVAEERGDSTDRDQLFDYVRRHDNLIITPHIGGCTEESMSACETFLAGKLDALLSSGSALDGNTRNGSLTPEGKGR